MSQSFSGFAEKLSVEFEESGKERTARSFRTVLRRLSGYLGTREIPFKEINPGKMKRFQIALQDEGLTLNTVSYYMRNLRSIFNKAVTGKLVKRPAECPFAVVFTGSTPTQKRALSIEEMAIMTNLELELEELHNSRQYLLFSFHGRGISFVDLCFLRKNNIRKGEIRYCRKKTGKELTVKITRPMREILNGFASQTKDSPFLFPILDHKKKNYRLQYESALGKQNRLLKELGRRAKLEKPLSTHVARHSWATIAYKRGATMGMVCQALGHRDEKTTAIYLASFNDSEIHRLSSDVSRLITKKRVKD